MDVKQQIKGLWKKGEENKKLGRYHEALALFEEARVMSSSLSVEDPFRSQVLLQLGICYTLDGQFSEGEKYLRESLTLRQQMHQNVGAITWSLCVLGDCLRRQHKLSDAEDVLKQALEQEENPYTANALLYMGWCLFKQKKLKQAQSHCERSIAMYRTRPLDGNAVGVFVMLGGCLDQQGYHTESVTSMRSAVKLAMKVEGPDGILVARCLCALSLLLNASGRYDECKAELQEALRIVRHHSLPHTHSLRVQVVRMLRECLTKQGKGEEAATVDPDIPIVCQPSHLNVLDVDVSVADLLVRDLPCDVKEDVYDHLDVTDASGGDWCHLAKEFGLSEQAVKKIRELYKERSEQVIQRWERKNGRKMCVNFLMDALRRMSECHPTLNLLERYMASIKKEAQAAGRERDASQEEYETFILPVVVQIPKRQGQKRPISAARHQQSLVSANLSECGRGRSLQSGCHHLLSQQQSLTKSTRHLQTSVCSSPSKIFKGLHGRVSVADLREVSQQIVGKWYRQRMALLEAEKKAIDESMFGGLVSNDENVEEEEVGGNSARAVHTRACCSPCVDKPPPCEVVDIVCRIGCSLWRPIGRGLGYKDNELENIVSAHPTCLDSEKLHKVVSQWMMKHGSCATLQWLVEVCQSEEVAIYGAVDMEICQLYGTSLKL